MAVEPTTTSVVTLTPTTEYTETQTRVPTATKTVAMTLTPTEEKKSKEEVDAWLLEKVFEPECDLPCFWGITPGETSWEDAVEEISPYADEVNSGDAENGGYYYAFLFYSAPEKITNSILSVGIHYEVEEILSITLGGGLTKVPLYSIPSVLSQYGLPGEVWLSAFSGYPNDDRSPRPSAMHMLYPEMEVLFNYWGYPGIVEDGIVKNCLEGGPSLKIWAPGELPSMETFDERFSYMTYPYLHVEEALGMNLNLFYETYKGESGYICIETPADLWIWGESETDQ